MEQIIYNLFVITSAVSVAMAAFAFFIRFKLGRKTGFKSQLWHLVLKAGWMGTAGVLMWAVLQAGTLSSITWKTIVFILSFCLTSVGFMGISLQAAGEVAEAERPQHTFARLDALEERADASEEREK